VVFEDYVEVMHQRKLQRDIEMRGVSDHSNAGADTALTRQVQARR
jgi:hypothetical protein